MSAQGDLQTCPTCGRLFRLSAGPSCLICAKQAQQLGSEKGSTPETAIATHRARSLLRPINGFVPLEAAEMIVAILQQRLVDMDSLVSDRNRAREVLLAAIGGDGDAGVSAEILAQHAAEEIDVLRERNKRQRERIIALVDAVSGAASGADKQLADWQLTARQLADRQTDIVRLLSAIGAPDVDTGVALVQRHNTERIIAWGRERQAEQQRTRVAFMVESTRRQEFEDRAAELSVAAASAEEALRQVAEALGCGPETELEELLHAARAGGTLLRAGRQLLEQGSCAVCPDRLTCPDCPGCPDNPARGAAPAAPAVEP